jgi:anthranilate synthase component I
VTLSVHPSCDAFAAHTGPHTHAAVYVRILADTETPISLFQKVAANAKNSFLLESVENGTTTGRYSFIGAADDNNISFQDGTATRREHGIQSRIPFSDPLDLIEEHLEKKEVWIPGELPRFIGGAVGYLGFDCVRYFEKIPLPEDKGIGIPESVFLLSDDTCIYDHLSRTVAFVTLVPLEGDREKNYSHACDRLRSRVQSLSEGTAETTTHQAIDASAKQPSGALQVRHHVSQQEMEATVRQCRKAIEAGEVFQIVPSQRLTVEESVNALDVYRVLRSLNPSPYHFILSFEGFRIVGSSPEVLVRVDNDDILIRPIAGTRPRGKTQEEEDALSQDLLQDEKECAEHQMLVDLGRNDLGKVSQIGSVEVQHHMHIEKFSHVMHMVSDVVSKRAKATTVFDIFRSCFPAGTVSGAPKIRACELLSKFEKQRRGVYAGAVGYFGYNNNMDTCIAIRTLVIEENCAHIQAGAGIVFDSDPTAEHLECLHKARAGLQALERCISNGTKR